MSRQETPFFLILLLIIAIIGAGVLFIFYQQARSDANVAVTSQFVAETRRETAAFSAQIASTGQAFAEWGQATAIVVAQLALTGQAQSADHQGTAVSAAETKQARAESDESTAVANANLAGTAQALAEETAETAFGDMLDAATARALAQENEAAAVANADLAATNAADAVGTANALATEQADALETIAALQGDLATLQYNATLDAIVNSTQRAVAANATAIPSDSGTGETPIPNAVRYVTSSGNLGFEYPETWIVQEQSNDLVVIVNTEVARVGDTFGEDEFFLALFPITAPTSFDIARATAVYAESVAENIGQGAPVSFDDPEILTIGGRNAGRVHGESEGYEAVVYMVHFEEESSVIVMMGLAAPGELTQFEPVMQAIAESLSYVAPAPTATP